MRSILFLALAISILPLKIHATEIDRLIKQLSREKNPEYGISGQEVEAAGKLQAIGPEAIPSLLHLLNDSNAHVRRAASFALGDIKGLEEADLTILINAFLRDCGSISRAIANVGGSRATDFLVAQLLHDSDSSYDIGSAFEILGKKAVPSLLTLYRPGTAWPDQFDSTMYGVFRRLGANASGAVAPLLAIASDEHAEMDVRIHAIKALGYIGLPAERIVPDLQQLMKSDDATIASEAKMAIIVMGGESSVPILLGELAHADSDTSRDSWIRQIGILEARGRTAGPTIVRYFDNGNWESRVGAVRTVGFIDYSPAVPDLIHLLECRDDWRVVLGAIESLGRLNSKEALPALTKTSLTHWYPPVRDAAKLAIEALKGAGVSRTYPQEGPWHPDAFDYTHFGALQETLGPEEHAQVRLPVLATREAIPKEIVAREEQNRKGGTICCATVEDGYLVGTNRGEWGGEITLYTTAQPPQVIFGSNTEAIYKTPRGIYAITGLAHLRGNHGVIHEPKHEPDGRWQAVPWRALPGAPIFSFLLKDGGLFVNCVSGMVQISPEGEMKALSREEVMRKATPAK